MNDIPRGLPTPIRKATGEFSLNGLLGRPQSIWERITKQLKSTRSQFLLIVLVPTLAATLFYGLIASKRYVSEGEYLVRGVSTNHMGGLSALLTSFGISRTADETAAIQDFVTSRDAIKQLSERVDLKAIYGRPGADFLSRYPRFWQSDNFENLYNVVSGFVSCIQDTTKGLTTLKVQAFTPEDAHLVATTLLQLAEEMVNRMNARAQEDSIKNATEEVTLAERDVTDAQAKLTEFRNKQLMIDPTSYSSILLAAVNKLSLDLVQTTASEKATLRMSPSNPALPSLEAQVDTLNKGIEEQRRKLGGSETALSGQVADYEKMSLMRDLAGRRYAQALVTLDNARQDAHRQQIYVEEVVRPNLPDDDIEPERLRGIITTFVMSFACFAMFWIVTVGAKDHAQ